MNKKIIVILLILLLLFISLLSISYGELSISLIESIKALFSKSDDYNNSVIQSIRLPRVIAGICVGSALSLSGLLTSIALRNPLADSGILGIQSGATIGALIAILVVPQFIYLLPLFSFIGGILVFFALLILTTSKRGFNAKNIVLVGVAINAFAMSITGTISIVYADRFKNALGWLNGSLATISVSDMKVILLYSLLFFIVTLICIPYIKILMLDDKAIYNIGYNPNILRFVITFIAVLMASISVAFVGVISFIGIIAPQIARRLVGVDLKYLIPTSALIGASLIVATDLFQRVLFAPMEIPVGILIGVIGAPIFISLARKELNG